MTIKDIAKESGYAVGTVSRVLNDHPGVSPAARETILAVVARHGFQPNSNARQLKQQGSNSVAVVVKGVGNLFFARVLEEAQRCIRAHGKAAAVYYLAEDDDEVEQAIRTCRELKPLGILFLGGDQENFAARFSQVRCPCVLVSTRADSWGFSNLSSISTDDVSAAEAAMGRLLDAGHRKVGVIGGQCCFVSPEVMSNASQLRLAGCIRACASRGVPFDPAGQTVESYYSLEGGYEATNALLDRQGDVTAIFAMCDVMALGALRAIRERGLRVSEDISVIGFDGIELGKYSTPKLSTVRQDGDRMARRGVEILLEGLKGGKPSVHEIVPFDVLPGESVRTIS